MLGTLDGTRREVTIVGAGIAGMLAAYALDKKGYEVTLLEEKARAGGLIQTVRTPHGIAERAAHSLLATPEVLEFCEELGVELAEIKPDSRARFVVRGGRLRKFPLTPFEALGAVRRLAFARGGGQAGTLDLDAWGRRHLGDAAVEYLLAPFVSGIYGVRPSELGVEAAFPELSVAPGKTLLGTLIGRKRRAPEKGGGVKRPKQRKRMVAPLRGMGDVTSRLERRLEERLGARFRRGVRVEEIPSGPNVIISTPAYAAAGLLEQEAPELSRLLREVRYTPIVTATAFVPLDALTKPVRGVGALSPAREGRKGLGVLFNSSSFEGRVHEEGRCASFTVLLGGTTQPRWVAAPDEEIAAAVRAELAELLGIGGEPLEMVVTRWPRAIPQYSTGLPELWRVARETWCAAPGRMLFGNYTGQVSLRGMIEESRNL